MFLIFTDLRKQKGALPFQKAMIKQVFDFNFS